MFLNVLNMFYFSFLGGMFDGLSPMNWETVKVSLNVLWKGLLAIFVVIFIIIIVVKVIQKIIIKISSGSDDE